MKINDLRKGYIVQTRCKEVYFVVDYKVFLEEGAFCFDYRTGLIDLSDFMLCMVEKEDYISEKENKLTLDFNILHFVDEEYNEDLTHKKYGCDDIMKVSNLFEVIWEREERL